MVLVAIVFTIIQSLTHLYKVNESEFYMQVLLIGLSVVAIGALDYWKEVVWDE